MGIKVKVTDKFKPLYNLPKGTDLVILIGGRGGMKTYEASKFAAYEACIKKRRVAVLRDEKETIRESILNEILTRYDTANKYGHFDGLYDKLETGIKDKITGQMMVFTKGFRASSNEKRTNLKGVSDTDTAIIEEAEDIRDFNKFSVFKDSIRTKDRLIIVILNTPDIQHWIVKRYFNLEQVADGYWKLIPKKLPGFYCIQSNYTDNEFLPESVVRDYKGYGDPESNLYDYHYYMTAILGYASSGRKGQVLTKVKPIKLANYLALDFREVYGQDFGTASPAGLVGCKSHDDNYYFRQLNYKPLDTLSIAKLYCTLGIHTENDIVIADSAEPLTIGQLRRGWKLEELSAKDLESFPDLTKGWNIRNALKGPGSLHTGLGKLNGVNMYVCEESTDFWNEIYNYVYSQDKSGEFNNEPIDDFNHLIDPARYIVSGRGRFY